MLLILVLIHAARAMAPPSKYAGPGFRVVRCFPKLSRRDADKAVCDGRVTVNGRVAKPALRVKSGDVVTLDGRKQDWEAFAASLDENARRSVVYNKPAGVTCTTDAQDRRSLRFQPALKKYFSAGRVFPVGRLDADSEGLVLLTDDGKCADALLQPKSKVAKTYVVDFERDVDYGDVTRLADGVEIETPQQRSGATTTQKTPAVPRSRPSPVNRSSIPRRGRSRRSRLRISRRRTSATHPPTRTRTRPRLRRRRRRRRQCPTSSTPTSARRSTTRLHPRYPTRRRRTRRTSRRRLR